MAKMPIALVSQAATNRHPSTTESQPAGSRPEWPAEEFTLWLVPHTLEVTTLKHWAAGTRVNLEADQIAKYVERLLAVRALAAQEVTA